MVPAGNNAKRLSSVNHNTKAIHHHLHYHHCCQVKICLTHLRSILSFNQCIAAIANRITISVNTIKQAKPNTHKRCFCHPACLLIKKQLFDLFFRGLMTRFSGNLFFFFKTTQVIVVASKFSL